MQGHSQIGKNTETHRRRKQKKPQVNLFPTKTNNALCKAELSQPEREIQTESQNTRKQVTPDFFQKKEKKKKVGGV